MSDGRHPIYTPGWIDNIIESVKANTGHTGWITPIELSETHPLVYQLHGSHRWTCFHCDAHFAADQVAIVMPFCGFEGENPRWIAYHRDCSLEVLGIKDRQDPLVDPPARMLWSWRPAALRRRRRCLRLRFQRKEGSKNED